MCRMVGGRRIRVGHSDTKARAFLVVMVEGYEGERRRDQAPSLSFPWQLVFFHSGSQVPSNSGTQTLPASPASTLFSEMRAYLPNHLGTWTLVYWCVYCLLQAPGGLNHTTPQSVPWSPAPRPGTAQVAAFVGILL